MTFRERLHAKLSSLIARLLGVAQAPATASRAGAGPQEGTAPKGTLAQERTAHKEKLPRPVEVAMAKAVALQECTNDEDLEWLRGRQDLDEKVRNEVFARMVARGGLFLYLIEKLVGFEDPYDRLPEPGEVAELGVPRFVSREK